MPGEDKSVPSSGERKIAEARTGTTTLRAVSANQKAHPLGITLLSVCARLVASYGNAQARWSGNLRASGSPAGRYLGRSDGHPAPAPRGLRKGPASIVAAGAGEAPESSRRRRPPRRPGARSRGRGRGESVTARGSGSRERLRARLRGSFFVGSGRGDGARHAFRRARGPRHRVARTERRAPSGQPGASLRASRGPGRGASCRAGPASRVAVGGVRCAAGPAAVRERGSAPAPEAIPPKVRARSHVDPSTISCARSSRRSRLKSTDEAAGVSPRGGRRSAEELRLFWRIGGGMPSLGQS